MKHNQITIETVLSIFNSVLCFLEKEGVNYALLPDRPVSDFVGKDIDVYTDNLADFTKVLQRYIASRPDIDLLWVKDHATGRRFNLVYFGENSARQIIPGPDVILYTPSTKGIASVSECVRRAKTNDDGIKILQYKDAYILYLLKAIGKQSLSIAQKEYLKLLYLKDIKTIKKEIEINFGNGLISQQINSLMYDSSCAIELQEKINKNNGISYLKYLKRTFWNVARFMRRLALPSGVFIVFLGPDGSGKTSVINKTIPLLEKLLSSNKQRLFHLRPYLGGKNVMSGVTIDNPHGQRSRGYVSSIVKILYFLLVYISGYLFIIRPLITGSTVVVFDRYYHDLLIDPKRYRYGGSMAFAKLIGKLIPKPDLYILLDASAEVIQSRKQEVPFEESARQRKEYFNFLNSRKNGVVVNASQQLDNVVLDVEMSIIKYVSNRTMERLGS